MIQISRKKPESDQLIQWNNLMTYWKSFSHLSRTYRHLLCQPWSPRFVLVMVLKKLQPIHIALTLQHCPNKLQNSYCDVNLCVECSGPDPVSSIQPCYFLYWNGMSEVHSGAMHVHIWHLNDEQMCKRGKERILMWVIGCYSQKQKSCSHTPK
jgi:hypothetical protein